MLYDPARESSLSSDSKSGLQAAANQYQWGLILGLAKVLNVNISVISSLPVGSFPLNNRRLIYKGFHAKHSPLIDITYIGFINFYIVKELFQTESVYRAACQRINKSKQVTVFIYGLELSFVSVVRRLKEEYSDRIKVILIVPDLPGKYGIQRKMLTPHGIWDRLFVGYKKSLSKYADGFVLLTQQMGEILNNRSRPSCIVEGFLPDTNNMRKSHVDDKFKVILYTGSLNKVFGIIDLINAFNRIDKNDFRLWICGKGECETFVREQSEMNKNIVYFGFVSKQQIHDLEQRATVLINPRKDNGEYTKYSFPSKTLEYLAVGKPIIMYRLPGIPPEYDDFLFYVEDNSTDALIRKILEVCSLSKELLEAHGLKAQEWATREKNIISQTNKIVSMLDTLE